MKVTSRYDYLGSTAIFLRNQEYDFHKKRLQTIRSNSSNMYYNHQHVENIKAHNAQRQHANKFYETVKQTEIASNNNKILRKIIQISSHSKEIPNISNIQQSTTIQSSTISPVRRPNPQQAQDIIRENNLLSTKILSAESTLDPRKFAQDYQHMKECKKRIQRFEVIDYSLNQVKLKAEDVANRSMQFSRKNSFYSQANPQSSLRTTSIPPSSAKQEVDQSQILSPQNIISTTRQATTPRQSIIDKSIRTRSCEKDQSKRQQRNTNFINNHRVTKLAESDQQITKTTNSRENNGNNEDNKKDKDINSDNNNNSNKTKTENNNIKADLVIKTENIDRKQEKTQKEDNNKQLSNLGLKNGLKQQPLLTSLKIENRKARSFSGVGDSQKYNQDNNTSNRQKRIENENGKINPQLKVMAPFKATTKIPENNNNQQIKQEPIKSTKITETKAISTVASPNGGNSSDQQDNLFRMQFGKGALKKGTFNANQSKTSNSNNSSLAWDGSHNHGKSNQTKISAKPQVFKPAEENEYEEDGFEDETSSPIKESIANGTPAKEPKKENNKSQK